MSGFEAVREDINESATAMSEAATGAKAADPSDRVQVIASALPGSASAVAASSLVSVWTARFTGWSTDAEGQAEALHDSAENYTAADHQNSALFRLGR